VQLAFIFANVLLEGVRGVVLSQAGGLM